MNNTLLIIHNDITTLNDIYQGIQNDLKLSFKTIYRAYNSIDGYNSALLHKPNIIIIASNLKEKSCFELVIDIRENLVN